MYAKTKNNKDKKIENKGLKTLLKLNKKAKEERIRWVIQNRLWKMLVVGNIVLQCRKEINSWDIFIQIN